MKEQETTKQIYLTKPQISKALKENTARILANIEAEMEKLGINRKTLADRIDSEATHISRMFRNRYTKNGLTTNVLGRIAIALNTSLTELVK